jgi:hypothetical protein
VVVRDFEAVELVAVQNVVDEGLEFFRQFHLYITSRLQIIGYSIHSPKLHELLIHFAIVEY